MDVRFHILAVQTTLFGILLDSHLYHFLYNVAKKLFGHRGVDPWGRGGGGQSPPMKIWGQTYRIAPPPPQKKIDNLKIHNM